MSFFVCLFVCFVSFKRGLSCWLSGRESTWQCRKHGFDLWIEKIPGEGNDNPLQYSCLGNPTDRGAWQATVHEVAKESDMTEWLNNNSKVLKECMKIVMNVLCPTPASVHFGYVYMTIHGWQGTKLCPVSWMLFCLSLFSVGPKASFLFYV